jgi:hypothetical protein
MELMPQSQQIEEKLKRITIRRRSTAA